MNNLEKVGCQAVFEGVHVAQTVGIQKYFQNILLEFDRIIEIGTYNGGLTLFIYRNKKEECELISYDIELSFNKVPKEYGIDFRIGDCFSSDVIDEIKYLISDKSKRVLLLCDAYKNEMFNLFSEFLKVNDVIMLHDFAESPSDFNIISTSLEWPYPAESSLSEINSSILKYNLSKYYYDEFKSVLWGSFIKK